MHELSLAHEICRIAEANAGHAGPAAVREVAVEVGDDAGSSREPHVLSGSALAQPPSGARPRLIRLPGDVLRVSYLEVDDGRPND